MFEYEIWGNSVQNWIISILIIVAAIVIVKLITLLSKRVLKPLTDRTKNQLDNIIFYSLEPPFKFAIILLGIWIAIHRLVYPDSFVKVVDNIYRILIVLDITWVFARLFSGLLQVYWGRRSDGQNNKMLPIIKRTILVVVWIIGLVMALSNVGVNISALLGTLGIGGIAFACSTRHGKECLRCLHPSDRQAFQYRRYHSLRQYRRNSNRYRHPEHKNHEL